MSEPIYITKPVPVFGINVDQESIVYEQPFSPYMRNVVVDSTKIRKRCGYSLLGFSSTDPPMGGIGMKLLEYKDAYGLLHLIALTTTNAYRYNTATGKWNCIDPSADVLTTLADGTGVVLRSDFNGLNNAVEYTDPEGPVATFAGNAKLSTAQKAYGTASLSLDGTNSYITYPDTASWSFGTGDFTIDFRVRFNSLTGNQEFVGQTQDESVYWEFYKDSLNHLHIYFSSSSVSLGEYRTLFPVNFAIDTWYHIAVVRSTTTCYIFVDGVSQHLDTILAFGTTDVGTAASVLSVGAVLALSEVSTLLNGYIDDLRIIKGSAKWTANFSSNPYFTGDTNDVFITTLATDMHTGCFSNNGGTALMLTNGVDELHYFEGNGGSAARFKVFYTDYGDVTPADNLPVAKNIQEFYNHFMYMNMASPDGTIKSLVHCAPGDIADNTGDTAGAYRLTDTIGEILRAIKLGISMVIYSENSITMCRYYGSTTLFSFPTVIHETGLLSANSVFGMLNSHYFIGTDRKLYVYYGDTQINAIGKNIETWMLNNLDVAKKNLITIGLDTVNHKIHFCIPSVATDYANADYVLNYDRPELSWEYHEYPNSVRSIASFENYFAWYTDESPVSTVYCDESLLYCDNSSGQLAFPEMAFISDNGYVYRMSSLDGSDNGSNIIFEVQTPDMSISQEEHFARWQWFSFVAMSSVADSTCVVTYSTDSGITWNTTIDSYNSIGLEWTTIRIPLDVVARKIRFKIYQDSKKDIQIRGLFKCKAVPQKERD